MNDALLCGHDAGCRRGSEHGRNLAQERAGLADQNDANAIAHNLECTGFEHIEPIGADGLFDQAVAFGDAYLRQIAAHCEYVVHGLSPPGSLTSVVETGPIYSS